MIRRERILAGVVLVAGLAGALALGVLERTRPASALQYDNGATFDDVTITGDMSLAGTMTSGTVPAPRFQRFEGQAENAGAVTVLAGATSIVSINAGSVIAGDRIFVSGTFRLTKGVTAGETSIGIDQSAGTAVVAWMNNAVDLRDQESSHTASTGLDKTLTGMGRVTTSGTLTVHLFATSGGSNGTVGAGIGELYVWVIPGS